MFMSMRRVTGAVAVCLIAVAPVLLAAQKDDKSGKDDDARRPKLTLKAAPLVSMAPARIVLTAELVGGSKDFEEYYCPSSEWEWGDGTQSESTLDCQPYEAGASEIRRRYTVEHVFSAGSYRVVFRLKRHGKVVASTGVNLQIQPGLADR